MGLEKFLWSYAWGDATFFRNFCLSSLFYIAWPKPRDILICDLYFYIKLYLNSIVKDKIHNILPKTGRTISRIVYTLIDFNKVIHTVNPIPLIFKLSHTFESLFPKNNHLTRSSSSLRFHKGQFELH